MGSNEHVSHKVMLPSKFSNESYFLASMRASSCKTVKDIGFIERIIVLYGFLIQLFKDLGRRWLIDIIPVNVLGSLSIWVKDKKLVFRRATRVLASIDSKSLTIV